MAGGLPGLVKCGRLVGLGLVARVEGPRVLELGGLAPTIFEGWTAFVRVGLA
jgi:hypothetical protein